MLKTSAAAVCKKKTVHTETQIWKGGIGGKCVKLKLFTIYTRLLKGFNVSFHVFQVVEWLKIRVKELGTKKK